jgi:hypothetical protein
MLTRFEVPNEIPTADGRWRGLFGFAAQRPAAAGFER